MYSTSDYVIEHVMLANKWLSLSCINTYLFSLGCLDSASDSNRRRNKG
jgi:hypothetical protein